MSAPQAVRPVVVTRAEGTDGPLSRELRGLGLKVLSWPAVSVARADPGALDAALAELQSFGWIVFASRHAVAAVLERLPAAPPGVRVAEELLARGAGELMASERQARAVEAP